jgi:predicted SAM-dependent methyltransferase
MFLDLLEQKKTHPLNPYQPTRPYRAKPEHKVKLNIACGPNIFPYPGWVNYDKENFSHYWKFLRTGERIEMSKQQAAVTRFVCSEFPEQDPVTSQDMTTPFPHADNSVDFIYVGQAIEHMNRRTQVIPFLQECRRMLKPGGVLRMTTPDLEILLEWFNNVGAFEKDQPAWFKDALPHDKLSYIMFGAAGPECTQTHYEGHMHIYTHTTMRCVLADAGFTQIAFDTPAPPEVQDEGMSHSFAVEATK